MIEPFNDLVGMIFSDLEGSVGTAAPVGILLLGMVTGLRHAMEADHIAAVSTILAGSNKKLRQAPLLGALWGLGHTFSLLVAGLAVLLLAVSIPERISSTLEFGVGVMLVFLALTTITGFSVGRFFRGLRGHHHTHMHVHKDVGIMHSHEHSHHDHHHGHKSLAVGMIHGMAGSGALMLAVLSTINSVPLGLAYIAIFGAGSIAGMMGISTLIGLPLAKASRFKFGIVLKYAAAVIALVIGVALIYDLGIVENIFLA